MEGYLYQVGSLLKSQKKRYFVLVEKRLKVYKTEKEYKSKKSPQKTYDTKGYVPSVYEPTKKKKKDTKFYFRLTHKKLGSINFSTQDRSNGIQWLKCFKSGAQKVARRKSSTSSKYPTKKPKLSLLDNLEDFTFLKTNYLLLETIKEKKIFFQGNIFYKDPEKNFAEEFFCNLTRQKLTLLPLTNIPKNQKEKEKEKENENENEKEKENEKKNEDKSKIEIEVSKIELISLTSDNEDQYKITIKMYNEKPKYLTSKNVVTILMVHHSLQFLHHPNYEEFLKNGPIQTTEQIHRLFYPLISKIFEIILILKNDFSVINYDNLQKKQNMWIEKIADYFSQKFPLQIISKSSIDNQSLQSLIMILSLILWLLPDPIFDYDFDQFNDLYDNSETLNEVIKKFVYNYKKCKPITREILGCVFLMAHILWTDLNFPILKKISQFFTNYIHFVKIEPTNPIEKQISYSKKHISYILFIISSAPILFYDKWSSIQDWTMGRTLKINESYNDLIKELYPTLNGENDNNEKKSKKRNSNSNKSYSENDGKNYKNSNENNQKKTNSSNNASKSNNDNDNNTKQPFTNIRPYIEKITANNTHDEKKKKIISSSYPNINLQENETVKFNSEIKIVKIDKSLSQGENLSQYNNSDSQNIKNESKSTNTSSEQKINIPNNQINEKSDSEDLEISIHSETEPTTDMEEQTNEESVINKLYLYFDKPLPLLPTNEFKAKSIFSQRMEEGGGEKEGEEKGKGMKEEEKEEKKNHFQKHEVEKVFTKFSPDMLNINKALEYIKLLKNTEKLKKENIQPHLLFEKILDTICFEMTLIGLDTTQDYSEFLHVSEMILTKFVIQKIVKAPILEKLNISIFKTSNDDQLALRQLELQKKELEKRKNKNRIRRRFTIKKKKKLIEI
ncbi:DNA polymerase zeta catalytic subunit [Anaeramoeba flamelloides]|uniref:DNA polymerase zeta catalytic subunit n=1 Tax=Anaeramoeba flamelloides TaxID=1746091 RepID=A0AAV7ZZX3_9EUKA|nr:DNA polymerase zeta catalytic subunit [Anaeramoeba flamelloides]